MLTSAQLAWSEKVKVLSPHKYNRGVTETQVRNLYTLKDKTGRWFKMTRDEKKLLLMETIEECTEDVAEKLVDLSIAAWGNSSQDISKKVITNTTTRSKITTEETENIVSIISQNFGSRKFQSKDIAPLITSLTARQIPSRLKKLVDAKKLEDCGGSPKSYKLV